jgi:hypothetical protein
MLTMCRRYFSQLIHLNYKTYITPSTLQIISKITGFFFTTHKSSKKNLITSKSKLHLHICTIRKFSFPFGNGLIIRETLQSKKTVDWKNKCWDSCECSIDSTTYFPWSSQCWKCVRPQLNQTLGQHQSLQVSWISRAYG